MSDHEFDIFLSHNNVDKTRIRAIAHGLRRRGIKAWLDEDRILAGHSFQAVIQEAIPRVRAATIFVGQNGLGNWQREEVQLLFSTCKKANKPLFLTLLPGVEDVPDDLGFLSQNHWVSVGQDVHAALDEIESGVRGEPASPFFDVLLCYDDAHETEALEIQSQLEQTQIKPWRRGLITSSLQISTLHDLDKDLGRIWSLAVICGANGGPWRREVVAEIILEFREQHRPVIPVVARTAPPGDIVLPVYLRRLGRVDFRGESDDAKRRLSDGITGGNGLLAVLT